MHADPRPRWGLRPFNLAYAAGLMIGPVLAGTGTDLAGFPRVVAALAALVAVVGLAGVLPRFPRPGRRHGSGP